MKQILAGFVVVWMTTGSVLASPISYQESVNGDLPELSPLPIFTLDVGSNTFAGRVSIVSPIDFDSFAFVIPSGMRLDSAIITGTGGVEMAGTVRTGSLTFAGTILGTFDFVTPTAASLGGTPLNPGTYHIFHDLLGSLNRSLDPTDYTWTLTVSSTVSAVPEPGTLGMAATGLLGLFMRLRRRS